MSVEMDSRPRRRRLAPEARKAQILDVVESLLAEKGYWGMAYSDIAKHTGVTVQAVMHYFPTKDELMLAVLARRDRVDITAVAPTDHRVRDADEFVRVIDRLVRRNQDRPALIQLYSILSAESLHSAHPAYAFFQERLERGLGALAALAEPWHPDPLRLAAEVYSALDGQQLLWLRAVRFGLVDQWRTWARHRFHEEFDFDDQ
jgi:AcrR family transcriptional regulator